jgi:hypothetical protein
VTLTDYTFATLGRMLLAQFVLVRFCSPFLALTTIKTVMDFAI